MHKWLTTARAVRLTHKHRWRALGRPGELCLMNRLESKPVFFQVCVLVIITS